MKHPSSRALAVASAAGLVAGLPAPAEAAVFEVFLTKVVTYTNSGTLAGNFASSTATFSYDDVALLTRQENGTLNVRFSTAPATTLFRTLTRGLVFGAGGAATATSFICQEGNFGSGVGASLCGNYTFGGNAVNESSTTWGPATATSRTLGGDDVAVGPVMDLSIYDGMNVVSWTGSSHVVSNRTCTVSGPCATLPGTFNAGYDLTYVWVSSVPVPAAAWLFGPALGVLGLVRRRPARRDPAG